jgi:hypothetical protein
LAGVRARVKARRRAHRAWTRPNTNVDAGSAVYDCSRHLVGGLNIERIDGRAYWLHETGQKIGTEVAAASGVLAEFRE